jgi:tripartite-type tricarboxylate transporter receptor subunit TctC
MHQKLICAAALMGAGVAAAQPAPEAAYPVKPIRMIVPNSPGSATDTVARTIAVRLAPRLGQQVLVENRGGAGGMIGSDIVAKAAPDGYTISLVSGTHTVNPSLYAKMPFDPIKDFAPITLATAQPYMLVAHPSLPARNIREMAALAKGRPGQINFGSSGSGSLGHLTIEQIKLTFGINMVHIPYKSIGPALTDVMGGHISMLCPTFVSALPQVRAGRLTGLGVSTANRATLAPEIPTIAEQGLPGFDVSGWFGLLTTGGTPPAIVNRLNQEIVAILQLPEVRERFVADGSRAVGNSPAEFDTHIKGEMARWAKVVKAANIKPE